MRALNTYREASQWLKSKAHGELSVDSRRIKAGDAFVAWPGYANDGRAFVQSAIDKGALACLVEEEDVAEFAAHWDSNLVATYKGLKVAGGFIADAYYENPSQSVNVLAVTGTNGKTSIAWWLSAALALLGSRCGVIGTLGVGELKSLGKNEEPSTLLKNFKPNGLTTPDPLTLHQSLKVFKESGVKYCALEASSIGIAEHRLNGLKINTAIFTNLSRDHLDYHKSMEEYWSAKSSLFDTADLVCAVINVDDPKGLELSARLLEKNDPDLKIIRVSEKGLGDLNASEITYPNALGGLGFRVELNEGASAASKVGYKPANTHETQTLDTKLVGRYNVSNLLCVIGTLIHLGYELQEVLQVCANLPPVVGRMQRVETHFNGDLSQSNKPNKSNTPIVVVDYAHTPDALENALESLRPLTQLGGQLYCMIGCGGDRDSGKRPQMAQVAYSRADKVVFTADNPRSEKAQNIIDDMLAGITSADPSKVTVELDRSKAISRLISQAGASDIVLLAGKGHEDYQEINGIKTPFSDIEQAKQALLNAVSSLQEGAL
jgi:UDP-N-acetylmuramoyl-L-alanyl-D-glutamate--2,6-diaminopimelate ligase